MRLHQLDGEMGLSGVRRAENGFDTRSETGIETGHGEDGWMLRHGMQAGLPGAFAVTGSHQYRGVCRMISATEADSADTTWRPGRSRTRGKRPPTHPSSFIHAPRAYSTVDQRRTESFPGGDFADRGSDLACGSSGHFTAAPLALSVGIGGSACDVAD